MITCGTTQPLGTFTQGEKPAPLVYQYLDADGVPIDLTGYTVKFVYTDPNGSAVPADGTAVDLATGKVGYTWTGNEFLIPGPSAAHFWVGNGTNRFASDLITWSTRANVGPVPTI